MKLKKFGVLSLIAVAAGMSLASCSGSEEDKVYNAGFIKEKTEITFWNIIGTNNQPLIENYIEEFKKLEPNVTVTNVKESTNYNGLATKASDGFATSTYPDIIQAYPDAVSDFLYYGKVVNLDSYMNSTVTKSGTELAGDYADSAYDKDETYQIGWTSEEKEDIIESYLTEGQQYALEGTYSLPFSKSTEAMFYNRALIGTTIPGVNDGKALDEAYFNNLTWEELFDNFCPNFIKYNDGLADDAKLLKSDKDYHAVFAYDSDDNLYITLCEQYGIDYTSLDKTTGEGSVSFANNTKAKELLEKLRGWYKSGYIITKGSAGDNYTNEYFTANNTLFSVGSTGGVKYQFSDTNPMDVGVACIPQPAGAGTTTGLKKAVINQGPSVCVLDHQDENRRLASWLFIKFISNYDNALDWAINSGYSGIRKSVLASDEYKDSCDVSKITEAKSLDMVMARCANYVPTVNDYLYTSPSFKGSSECRDQAGGLITSALTKTDDIDSLLNAAQTAANVEIG